MSALDSLALILAAGLLIRWARNLVAEEERERERDGMHRPSKGPQRRSLASWLSIGGTIWRQRP